MNKVIPTKVVVVAGFLGLAIIVWVVWRGVPSAAPATLQSEQPPVPASSTVVSAEPPALQQPTQSHPQAVAPAPAPQQAAVGISIGDDFSGLSDAQLNAELSDMRALGARYLRFDLDWSVIERRQGRNDWSVPDRIVAATLAHGLVPLPIIDFTPAWARLGACADTNRCEPADTEDFANFAHAAAARYASQGVHDWEIWNEPNDSLFWQPAPDADVYSHMLQESYRAIKAADPRAVVIVGGLAAVNSYGGNIPPLQFLAELYNTGAGGHFDGVGFHPYSFPQLPSDASSGNPWHEIANTNPSLLSIMTDNGDGNKPIWITEYGAPTGGPGGVSEARQAQLISDAVAEIKKASWAGPMFIYSYQDAGTDQSTKEDFFGLLRFDGSQKPAYHALQDALTAQ